MSAYLSFYKDNKDIKENKSILTLSRVHRLVEAIEEVEIYVGGYNGFGENQEIVFFEFGELELAKVTCYINKEIAEQEKYIGLELFKKDYDSTDMREEFKKLYSLIEVKGMLSMLYELMFDNNYKLYTVYG